MLGPSSFWPFYGDNADVDRSSATRVAQEAQKLEEQQVR